MKTKLAATLCLFFSLSAGIQAEVQQYEIMGQTLNVKDVSYFSELAEDGSQILHSGTFVDATKFSLADNNQLELKAGTSFWLHQNGNISNLMNIGYLNYKLVDQSTITFDCRKQYASGAEIGRITAFHPNGRYHRGCQSVVQKWLESDQYKINVRFSSYLDLNDQGKVEYASKVSSDSMVILNDQSVLLNQGSSVAFHNNGTPRFFTIKAGEEIEVQTKNIGTITLHTDPKKPQAVTLTENGDLVIASVKGKIKVNFKGETHEFSSLAAQFYPTGELFSLFVTEDTEAANPELEKLITTLRGGSRVICLDKTLEVRELRYCAEQFSAQ